EGHEADGDDPEDQPDGEAAAVAIVGVVAIGFVALTRPEVITGSFGTVQSTLRVLGLIAAFALVAYLVRRFVTNRWAARGIVWGLGAALILVAVVPSYIDEEVDQDLATSAADLGLEEPAEPGPDEVADEGAAPADGDGDESVEASGDEPETAPAEEPAALPEPVKLTTGQLSG
ncbi:MAG: hypothetical protein AAGK32_22650, partial [Actinomycetota bacterium]